MTKLKIFFSLFIFAIIIFISKTDKIPEMHFIVSGTLNGTAAFASLDSISEKEKYLYFTFDFEFHSSAVPKSKDIAYFLISSDFDLENSKKKIKIGFLEKTWKDINGNDNDIKNIKWEKIKLLHKEKPYNDINYYYEVERKDQKMKSLIIRVPTNGRREGSINIENILTLPDFNENEKNSDI